MGRLQDILSLVRDSWAGKTAPEGVGQEETSDVPTDTSDDPGGGDGQAVSAGRLLLWGVLWFSLIVPIGGERVEVFSAVFLGNQGMWGWVLLAAALVGSLMAARFYCRALCPMNAFFQDLETARALCRRGRGELHE